VRQRLGQRLSVAVPGDLKIAARAPGQYVERLVVKDGTRVHIIPTAQLEYAEAQDDYVALHSGGKSYLKQQTISSLEASLDPAWFVRVHRSFLVNLARVTKIEPYTKDTRLAILAGGSQVPVSRAGYTRLRELMGKG
jgi:two-component system LytT family response regulator